MALSSPAGRSDTTPASTRTPAPWMDGMTTFAGVIMIVAGVLNAIEGLVALFQNQVYVVGTEYIFAFDLTTWGWTHLIIGAVGFAVLSGHVWGRAVGIAIAVVSMLANFLFIPYYPVWSLLIIVLNVFVIWALCASSRHSAVA
jgi:hypothetical protein